MPAEEKLALSLAIYWGILPINLNSGISVVNPFQADIQ
ncbi:putative membrane protein [Yersinia rochesterensis]|uniref:Membrane protein n=1 Tax=Yersinia rochesterensis TaxID=1604335 RepID=A0ABM5SRP0_9GAMM|nr:putative membrane protein [Yersinia rochesterensis]AJI87465.1 putative membrane protein [Yersinia frederiksenii Y225]AJJ37235.1 putative membrane protein [Yersinia rochesterensis]CNH32720.1 Uncharacterised protein [Yersinia kristensenii]CRY64050.1 Uncharacterised protein [Yersinia kristensenii]